MLCSDVLILFRTSELQHTSISQGSLLEQTFKYTFPNWSLGWINTVQKRSHLRVPIQRIFRNKYLLQTALNLRQDSTFSAYQKAKTIQILKMAKARSEPTKALHTNPSSPHSTLTYHSFHWKSSCSPDCSSTQTEGFLTLQFSATFSHFCGLTHFCWGWTALRSPAAQKQAQGSLSSHHQHWNQSC